MARHCLVIGTTRFSPWCMFLSLLHFVVGSGDEKILISFCNFRNPFLRFPAFPAFFFLLLQLGHKKHSVFLSASEKDLPSSKRKKVLCLVLQWLVNRARRAYLWQVFVHKYFISPHNHFLCNCSFKGMTLCMSVTRSLVASCANSFLLSEEEKWQGIYFHHGHIHSLTQESFRAQTVGMKQPDRK